LDRSVLSKLRTEKDLNTVTTMAYEGRDNSLLDDDDDSVSHRSSAESNDNDDRLTDDNNDGLKDDDVHVLNDGLLNELSDCAMNSSSDAGSLDGHDSFLADFATESRSRKIAVQSSTPPYYSIASPVGDCHNDSLVAAATPATKSAATQLRSLANKHLLRSEEHNTRSKRSVDDFNDGKKDDPCWEQEYSDKKAERMGLTLEVVLRMKIRQYICVMWNYDNTDINDIRNFCPAYLRKVSKEKYEVMDDRDDICFAELLVDGDEGLKNLWGTYLKTPTDEFHDYCVGNRLFHGGYNRATHSEDGAHKVTPRRKIARDTAADNMNRTATKIYNRVKSKSGNVTVGDVVHIGIVPQDRGKVDPTNLIGVVVNINEHYGICQVAVKTGLLRPWYVYHKLRVLVGKGNNRKLHDLEDIYNNWRQMETIAPRTASTRQSLVGGHGIYQCKCRGTCKTNSCSCFKNNRICTSACHRNSKCCQNHDQV